MLKKEAALAAVLIAGCNVGHAQDAGDSPEKKAKAPWSGNISVGYLSTTGNTDKTTATGGLDLTHDLSAIRDHFKLDATYSTNAGEKTAERYQGSAQRDFKLSGNNRYLFTRGTALKDEFSGYDYVLTASAGYGFRVWEETVDYNEDNAFLDLEVGPGYRYAKIHNPEQTSEPDKNSESSATVRTGAKFQYPLSDDAEFNQSLDATLNVTGDDNLEAESQTALVAHVMDRLAVELSYSLFYVKNPPDAKASTDTQTKVSLLYKI